MEQHKQKDRCLLRIANYWLITLVLAMQELVNAALTRFAILQIAVDMEMEAMHLCIREQHHVSAETAQTLELLPFPRKHSEMRYVQAINRAVGMEPLEM